MKIRSKLADIEFRFGRIDYKKDHLILHSHPDQPMQSKAYVSPDDVAAALGCALRNPMVWLYIAGLPFFLVRYRLRRARQGRRTAS